MVRYVNKGGGNGFGDRGICEFSVLVLSFVGNLKLL